MYPTKLRSNSDVDRLGANRGQVLTVQARSQQGNKIAGSPAPTDGVSEGEKRLRQVLEALPAAIYTTDADGRLTYYNEAAAQLAGRRPSLAQDEWCVTWRLYRMDG